MAREDSLLENLKKMAGRMNANYQPIVIKMLLEDPQHTITIQNIRKKFDELNFGRANFVSTDGGNPMGNSAIKSVREALRNFVKFPEGTSNGNVTLIEKMYDEKTKDECLKICGQNIADWHIKDITKNNYEMWHILPGSRDEDFVYLDEFIKTNTIGVGWSKIGDISNFSDLEIEKTFEKSYDEGLGSFQSFTKIKPKDIVVLTRGQEEIIDFGIVTSDYEFLDVVKPSYPHRKNIVWLNQGPILASELPRQSLSFIIATCGKLDKRKQEMVDVLLNTHTKQQDNQKYFILTQNFDSDYEDTDKQYHFQKGKPGSGQLTKNGKNAKFIIQSKIEGQNYFLGRGIIGTFSEKTSKNNERLDIIANYSTYEKFEEPKIRTEDVHHQMKSSPSYGGRAPAILPIPRSLYVKILGEDLTSEDDQIVSMTKTRFQSLINENKEKQIRKYKKILDQSKGQIIFYGPPGTGKTYIAKQLANHITKVDLEGWKASTHRKIVQFHPSYSYEDFVQGIKPVKDGDAINYVLQPGIFQKLCKPTVILPTMSWRTAAIYVLNENTSLHYKEINKISYELGITPKDTWQLKSGYPRKTPWITQSREITEDIRTNNKNSIFKKSLNDDGEEISAMYELNLKSPTYEDEIRNLPEAVIDKSPKILIIDEINRGNLSKIFGELIYALEYRGEEIDLQYKEFSEGNDYGTLTIPLKDQLMIIGTMNTADRSIILFDAALRRRFSFIPLLPDYDLLAQSLDIDKEFDETEFKTRLKSLEEDGKDEKKKILSILALYKINLKLSDNVSVGREKQIGHTFLLEMQSHPENFTKIWAQDILPLLEEYYFESPETIEEWFTPDVYSKQKGIMEFNNTILEKSLNGLLFSPDE